MTSDPAGSGETVAADEQSKGAHSLTAKAVEEFRRFVVLFFYLWVLFAMFVLNQSIVLREEGIPFIAQGVALVNALVLAKVMLLFEAFDPGRWLRRRPLIYPILYESFLLTVLFLVVYVLEKVIDPREGPGGEPAWHRRRQFRRFLERRGDALHRAHSLLRLPEPRPRPGFETVDVAAVRFRSGTDRRAGELTRVSCSR
jgi:hypothetical protein